MDSARVIYPRGVIYPPFNSIEWIQVQEVRAQGKAKATPVLSIPLNGF
jgi:hypothetical protein